jgi:DNA-binding HxlR family transcriptional regulator
MSPENTAKQIQTNTSSLKSLPRKDGKMDVEPLDSLIHERMRLAIVSALAVNNTLTFRELKQLLGMSDGNLSVHTQKLEAGGFITCSKAFEGRQPKTEYALTPAGRTALEHYLGHMESIINAVRKKK